MGSFFTEKCKVLNNLQLLVLLLLFVIGLGVSD